MSPPGVLAGGDDLELAARLADCVRDCRAVADHRQVVARVRHPYLDAASLCSGHSDASPVIRPFHTLAA